MKKGAKKRKDVKEGKEKREGKKGKEEREEEELSEKEKIDYAANETRQAVGRVQGEDVAKGSLETGRGRRVTRALLELRDGRRSGFLDSQGQDTTCSRVKIWLCC